MQTSLVAVKIAARSTNASQVQDILTKYGCQIKVRVGFHDTDENMCSTDGIIVMQLFGKEEEITQLFESLNVLNGVQAQFITFE